MAENARNIQDRSMEYAVRAVKLFRHFQKTRDPAAMIVARQYLRSATSIGANMIEAQSGESRRDFIHKCSVAQKEAREAKYWLLLMGKSELATKACCDPIRSTSLPPGLTSRSAMGRICSNFSTALRVTTSA